MRMLDRRSIPALLGLALMLAAPPAARGAVNAQVVPVKYSLTCRPGEAVVRDVEIANQGEAPVVVRVTWSDWQMDEAGNLTLVPEGSTPSTLKGLVDFEPQEFSVGPHESAHVRVTARMPADGPATRWGVMLSEVKPVAAATPQLGPRASAQLGTTFYLSRVPAEIVNAEVVGMAFKPLGTSLAVSIRVRNAGERHYYVGGRIALADSTGQAVAGGDLPTGVVLPGQTRTFQWVCAAAFLPGRYLATATLDTGAPELTVVEGHFEWPLPRARTLAAERP
jgi:hypothetical protein